MPHITAIGELLIDFLNMDQNLSFSGTAGGAPCNVMAQAARLGNDCTYITKLGNDYFGDYLKNYISNIGIDTSYFSTTDDAHTTLAFVNLDDDGNRSFTFYRKPGADMMLEKNDIPIDLISNSDIFHYGGVILSKQPSRDAVFYALDSIKNSKVIKAYDPNLRFNLWDNNDEIRDISLKGIEYADILKISDEEILFLTNTKSIKDGLKIIKEKYNVKIILITLGKYGCIYSYKDTLKHICTYAVQAIDTTASGDSFFGAFLHKLLSFGVNIDEISIDSIESCVEFGNASGALTATKKGAINSLPSIEDIENCVKTIPKFEN